MLSIELIVGIGSLASIIVSISSIAYWLGRKFEAIDKRFEAIDKRFEAIDKRFEAIDKRFEAIDNEIRGIRREIVIIADSIRSSTLSINSMLIEFLGVKGVITREESTFLVNEARRLSPTIILPNPISKEDSEFLKNVLNKDVDDISIEEAERISEIGKKIWIENGSEAAYKIFLTGLFIKAYHLGKKYKKQQ